MKTSRLALVGLALVLGAVHLTCHQVLFTAPPGSSMQLIANPTFIPANTGVSVITAVLYDGTGSPVADGTVVQFFTDLGRVDEQGRTNDGVARVNLYADSRSGTATVQAISGSEGAAPSPTATPPPGSLTGQAEHVKSVAAVAASAFVPVTIGSANPTSMIVTANPQRITTPRYSTIVANVFDTRGNPVSNVPVFFTIALPTDSVLQETLDSAGSPRFTDNNGRATDVLRTSYDPAERPKTVTVNATVPVGTLTGSVPVAIN